MPKIIELDLMEKNQVVIRVCLWKIQSILAKKKLVYNWTTYNYASFYGHQQGNCHRAWFCTF